jgi:hypothetical protein
MTDPVRHCRKDWLYGVLYAASQDATAPRCAIVIPLTLLFRDGLPDKVLVTDSAKKCVTGFSSPFADVLSASASAATPVSVAKEAKALRRKCTRYCVDMLREYSEQNGFAAVQHSVEPLVCSVTYVDGEREDLSLAHFDRLSRNDTWCQQLILVQGFVPYQSLEAGLYRRRSAVRSRIEENASEAADQLTRSLANFVDQVYATRAEKVYNARAGGEAAAAAAAAADTYMDWSQGPAGMDAMYVSRTHSLRAADDKRAAIAKETTRVKEMRATYGLDPHNRVILLAVESAALENADTPSEAKRAVRQDIQVRVVSTHLAPI